MLRYKNTRYGRLLLAVSRGVVYMCDWESSPKLPAHLAALRKSLPEIDSETEGDATLMETADHWVTAYLEGEVTVAPPLIVKPAGSEFRREVWDALRQIPYGETMTYKALAARIGKPQCVRVVASACADNPVSLFIPCHRVIGADGTLRGYAGGKAVKRHLLLFEQTTLQKH